MRVFYAVTFSEETKKSLVAYRDLMANKSIKGRFTVMENFHLTLAFIGEVPGDTLEDLLVVLGELTLAPFQLEGTYIGAFEKKNRRILWMGLENNKVLKSLQKQLVGILTSLDIPLETRKYKPHITLGRQVLLAADLEELVIEPLHIIPKGIALMESKRVGDRLVYEPLAELPLPLLGSGEH